MRARVLLPILVLTLAVLVGVGLLLKRRYFPAPALRLVYRVKLDPRAGGSEQEQLRRMTEGVRRRAEGLVPAVQVRRQGKRLAVELPAISARALKTFKRRLVERVRFELRRVDDASGLIHRMIVGDPPPEPIRVKRNDYETAGRTVRYVTLVSPYRQKLERYLEQLPAQLKPGPDRELVLGEGWGPRGRGMLYELFVVHRKCALSGRHVTRADAFQDRRTGRFEVEVTFTAEGARRFEELTRAAVGQRLAIMLDGRVSSAPVVQSPIRGGRARISIGGYKDPATQQIEAEELAAALEAGALPGELELLREQRLE